MMRQIFQHQLVGTAESGMTFILMLVVENTRHVAVHYDIVFGLAAIKNVGEGAINSITKEDVIEVANRLELNTIYYLKG